MARVSFKNIHKVFDDGTRAVTNFNLDISDGEFVVLVGPSGCGKSTLLRILAGLETATEGEILIDDKIVNQQTPQQRNIAMVFQNYALYPHMTVQRNLEFPLKMMKLPKTEIEKRVASTTQLLGLDKLLERRPKQLSGGQRQRVAMGRAIVRRPSAFLMDEPLSNLDAKLRVQIRSEIAALQQRLKTTTLYVTHDQVEAMTLGDRVAVINQGVLQQVATPQTLYQQPANLFVASFIGNPGMNLFATELHQIENNQLAIQWGEQQLILPDNLGKQKTLHQYVGKSLYAGLRPEAFFHGKTTGNLVQIKVKIESIEALGHESLIYFHSDLRTLNSEDITPSEELTPPQMVARLPAPIDIKAGEQITFGIALDQLYFFDTDGIALP